MPKAEITAIVNQKGGTGKTTTAENLGVGLAREGRKVLLVDTDPQASLTIALGNPRPDDLETTITDLMQKTVNEEPIRPGEGILHHPEGVDYIPSSIELSGMIRYNEDDVVTLGGVRYLLGMGVLFDIDENGNERSIDHKTIGNALDFMESSLTEISVDGKTYDAFRLV